MKRILLLLTSSLVLSALCAAQANPGNYLQEGIASWYGTEFDGRSTASGETFNSKLFTAAHPTLPLGTLLMVTNTHNNRSVLVKVNDRGPYARNRIIDLSQAAAQALDMIATGTAPVVIEVVKDPTGPVKPAPQNPLTNTPPANQSELYPAVPEFDNNAAMRNALAGLLESLSGQKQPAGQAPAVPSDSSAGEYPAVEQPYNFAPSNLNRGREGAAGETEPAVIIRPAVPPLGSTKTYRIQVGAYQVPRFAVDSFDRLKEQGLDPAYEKAGDYYRVVLAGLRSEEIRAVSEKLSKAGFLEVLIREER